MPQRLLVCRRWIRGRCWLCALSNVCCGFMSEQMLYPTRCMSLSLGGICLGSKYLPLPSMGMINTPSGRTFSFTNTCQPGSPADRLSIFSDHYAVKAHIHDHKLGPKSKQVSNHQSTNCRTKYHKIDLGRLSRKT